jgi:Asp/Glu/hydantoin racemase
VIASAAKSKLAMKRLAVLHTVALLADRFKAMLRERVPDLDAFHMIDESLLQDLMRHGPSPAITRRVVTLAGLAADAGADLILFTCSSTSPAVDVARQVVETPILKIDDPMAEKAVRTGRRIGLLCTATSTVVPSTELVRSHAARLEREVLVEPWLVEGAFAALQGGDRDRHDTLIGEAAVDLAGRNDVLILAQASMAHLAEPLAERLPLPVLSSPKLAVDAIAERYGMTPLPLAGRG